MSAENHACVVCRNKMSADEPVCPRCKRKAHLKDYETEGLETYKAGMIPRVVMWILMGIEAILIYQLLSGQATFLELIIPFVIVSIAYFLFWIISKMYIKIGEEYFILNDEVGFYKDIISSKNKKAFDLRRDRRLEIYTLPPNVDESQKVDFTIFQVCFGMAYKRILDTLEEKYNNQAGPK